MSFSGVSAIGSMLREMKWICFAESPSAVRTSLSLRVISGQASPQEVNTTLSSTTRSFSTSL
ncbi:hypothetical protein D3C80_1973260 [compost metagenome]